MIFLYILLGIIAFITILLLCNIKIKIVYAEELNMSFYFGFFKIPTELFKKNNKKKRTDKKPKSEIEQKPKKKPKKNKLLENVKNKGYYESFVELIDVLKPIFKTLNSFTSKFKINPLIIKIRMTGDDAAKLAIDYGKFCAVYYPLIELINTKTNCKNINSDVFVDYTSNKPEIYVKTQIKIRLIHGVTHSFKILQEFLKFKSKFD